MNHQITSTTYDELFQIEDRLENEHVGYGMDFGYLFESAVKSVIAMPEAYPRAFDAPRNRRNIREYFIKRFNYRLLYIVYPNNVVFIGLIHAHRRPGSWTSRLRDLPKS
jgi:hypothetical protein